MRKSLIIIAAILILIPTGITFGDEGKLAGEVSLTGVVREGKDKNAKFNEYRDIRDGAYGSIDLRYDAPKDHASFEAMDMGYSTQRYRLEGGRWDVFKVDMHYEEIPHNYTYDARSLYSGVGTRNLTYGPGATPSTNSEGWNTFDYTVKRKNMGGSLKFDLLSPFYVDVSVNQQRKAGVYALGAAGTSPGGIAIELPSNIDYTTNNIKAALGYSTKPFQFSVNYLYSRFDNGDGFQNFRNPATANTSATTDTLLTAPNNNYNKIDVQGGIKLPWQSKLNVDLSSSRAESSALLGTSYVTNTTAAASNIGTQGRTGIGLSSPFFDGKVNTDSYNVALTSNPLPFFNAKLYYKYYNRSDVSTRITTTDGANILLNDLFGYRKNTYGLEMGFKLPASLRLTTIYNFIKTERQREDLPKNRDNLVDVGLRWSGLKFMAVKAGYEYRDRSAEFFGDVAISALEPWIRRYDAAPFLRHTFKTSIEVFPLETLSFNVGYKYKETKYTDTTLGLTDTKAHVANFDIDWQIHRRLRFFGYFDFEQRILNQFQRNTANDPATPPTATAYNWTSLQRENTFGYGLGSDIAIIPDKLTLKLSHNFVKSDGVVDYTYLAAAITPAGRTQDNIDLNTRDTYRLTNYIAKLTYQMNKAIALTAAYAYEEFTYDDSQYNGYRYFLPGAAGAYLTGAYSDPSYRTHVGMLSVNLKF
jgi:MtrB/PioB family decaheme-associated outer membrane protein